MGNIINPKSNPLSIRGIKYIFLQLRNSKRIRKIYQSCYNFYFFVDIFSLYYLAGMVCPNEMFIKSAPYLHKKSANWVLDMVLFYALVLMLLNKFVQNSNLEGAVLA